MEAYSASMTTGKIKMRSRLSSWEPCRLRMITKNSTPATADPSPEHAWTNRESDEPSCRAMAWS